MKSDVPERPGQLLRAGWQRFKQSRRAFVISTLVLLASWVCLEVAVVALQRWGAVPNVMLHVAFLFVASGLMAGLHGMALRVVDGGPVTLHDLTRLLGRGPSFLLASILYSVSVLGGLLLLVVPGVYVAVRYALFGQVIAAGPASAVQALREAGALSRGRWWPLFRLLALVIALNVAGAALLGVGMLVTFPVSVLALAGMFRALQRAEGEA